MKYFFDSYLEPNLVRAITDSEEAKEVYPLFDVFL